MCADKPEAGVLVIVIYVCVDNVNGDPNNFVIGVLEYYIRVFSTNIVYIFIALFTFTTRNYVFSHKGEIIFPM